MLAIRSLQQLKANPVSGFFNPSELRETRDSNLWHFFLNKSKTSRGQLLSHLNIDVFV